MWVVLCVWLVRQAQNQAVKNFLCIMLPVFMVFDFGFSVSFSLKQCYFMFPRSFVGAFFIQTKIINIINDCSRWAEKGARCAGADSKTLIIFT